MTKYMSVRVEVAVDIEPGTEREVGALLAEVASHAVVLEIRRQGWTPDSRVAATNPQHAATVVRR